MDCGEKVIAARLPDALVFDIAEGRRLFCAVAGFEQLTGTSLSVVVSAYNVEQYLVECLESLLANEEEISEILCINDGSTDASGAILNQFSELNSKVHVLEQQNKGLSEARNVGLGLARGEYVMFVDGDDTIAVDSLAGIPDFARRNGLDYLAFGIGAHGDVPGSPENNPFHELSMRSCLYSSGLDFLADKVARGKFNPMAQGALYRRQFLMDSELRFVPGILHEDNIFTVQTLYRANRVAWFPRAIYLYRDRPDSITTMRKRAEHTQGLLSCRFLMDELAGSDFPARKISERLPHTLAIRYVKNILTLEAQRAYRQASANERQRFESWSFQGTSWGYSTRLKTFRFFVKPVIGAVLRQSLRILGIIIRILISIIGPKGKPLGSPGRRSNPV